MRASIWSGVLRRAPAWPSFAPGLFFRRFDAGGFWYTGTIPDGVEGEEACGCNRAICALAVSNAKRTASGPRLARRSACDSLSAPRPSASSSAYSSSCAGVFDNRHDVHDSRRWRYRTCAEHCSRLKCYNFRTIRIVKKYRL